MPSPKTAKNDENFSGTLLSILLIDYAPQHFEKLLDQIFEQKQIDNFEIILCDNALDNSIWDIGNKYSAAYPGKITLLRTYLSFDTKANHRKMLAMARGKYYALLSKHQNFDPNKILKTIETLESDPLCTHQLLGRVSDRNISKEFSAQVQISEYDHQPLVSVCIYNYNYGRYLSECLDSVAAQTYKNIEISFSDNASTDDSWQIAMDFAQRHPEKISLVRNRENFGAGNNLANCRRNAHGKYLLMLCSDDAIKPDFIERCVTLLEKNPETAFALVHREIIDEAGNVTPEPPFYDQTCLIRGEEQAAVYMMAAVNPSISQVLYNHEKLMTYSEPHGLAVRWFGQRLMDFFFCLESPIIYIKDPLLLNRVHDQSDGAAIDSSLVQGIGQYMLALQFAEMATQHGLPKPAARLGAAIEKIGRLCLRYCTTFLLRNDETTALRYLHLAQALFPSIAAEENCQALKKYWDTDANGRQQILSTLAAQAETTRKVSYAPPPHSIPC
jgi:glycosyltransferase involved in cell wall biosynthesis